jgi:hypothetical protein
MLSLPNLTSHLDLSKLYRKKLDIIYYTDHTFDKKQKYYQQIP